MHRFWQEQIGNRFRLIMFDDSELFDATLIDADEDCSSYIFSVAGRDRWNDYRVPIGDEHDVIIPHWMIKFWLPAEPEKVVDLRERI